MVSSKKELGHVFKLFFTGGLECVGHSFAYFAHFGFLYREIGG
jgi:hypothetical protein